MVKMKTISILAIAGLVLALAPAAQATIVAITDTGLITSGTTQVDQFVAGGVTYTTATDLSLGTSVDTDSYAGATNIEDQDDFDISTYFGRGGNAADKDWTTSLFGGVNWSDTNGDDEDFFIFERGGGDTIQVRPIFADDSFGTFVTLTSGSSMGDTQVNAGGQNIFGLAFAITDLLDGSSVALTNSSVIKGLDFDGPNADIASISAVSVSSGTPGTLVYGK